MTTLVCGSMAYDNIMVFQDHFKNHILPDKIHILSVAFLVPEMHQEFGGCAGNIVYGMKLLGLDGYIMGTVGRDFEPYANWLKKHNISTKHINIIEEEMTANAIIITDLDDNQITAFHPGAMDHAHLNSVQNAKNISLGVIAPDGKEAMLTHANEFNELNIPFIFDPGQQLPTFSGEELNRVVKQCAYLIVNDYEWEMVKNATGLSESDVLKQATVLIITKGANGSTIFTDSEQYDIPAAKAYHTIDPTGCGDAYRAGIVYGLEMGLDWETTGRIASLMGAKKIENSGTQNYHFTLDDFDERFKQNFGYSFKPPRAA